MFLEKRDELLNANRLVKRNDNVQLAQQFSESTEEIGQDDATPPLWEG